MAELDIEALKKATGRARELETADGYAGRPMARQVWLYVDQAEAIIAALEDRERLRADVEDYRQRLRATSDAYNEVANDRERLRAALEQIRDITSEEALTRPGSNLNGILLAVWHHVNEALEGRDG